MGEGGLLGQAGEHVGASQRRRRPEQGALVANYPWDGTPDRSTAYTACPDDAAFKHLAALYATTHRKMALPNNRVSGGCRRGWGLAMAWAGEGMGRRGRGRAEAGRVAPPNWRRHSRLARVQEFPRGGTTNGAAWYPIYGSMQDWNYIVGGCMELTLELRHAHAARSTCCRACQASPPRLVAFAATTSGRPRRCCLRCGRTTGTRCWPSRWWRHLAGERGACVPAPLRQCGAPRCCINYALTFRRLWGTVHEDRLQRGNLMATNPLGGVNVTGAARASASAKPGGVADE